MLRSFFISFGSAPMFEMQRGHGPEGDEEARFVDRDRGCGMRFVCFLYIEARAAMPCLMSIPSASMLLWTVEMYL
jgi:hypothetical protein